MIVFPGLDTSPCSFKLPPPAFILNMTPAPFTGLFPLSLTMTWRDWDRGSLTPVMIVLYGIPAFWKKAAISHSSRIPVRFLAFSISGKNSITPRTYLFEAVIHSLAQTGKEYQNYKKYCNETYKQDKRIFVAQHQAVFLFSEIKFCFLSQGSLDT